ncbi:Bax inhibitor-1/YccA family protein [Hydrotalea sp.]|uniref:Bax inhibitor-1/YccA family protein n=1 Tax=Hydrotalea sp. TaxID=2881279 RepID=UPI0026111755|nr:Bax inhibitor-1/YccA family protein [Hydrotalea sp.]
MAIFKSGNPTLTEKIFDNSLTAQANAQGIMSVRGTLNKFGFLMLMVIGGAFYTWHTYQSGQPGTTTTLMMVGVFGGLIAAIAIMFKPMWAGYIAPAYGILEGLFIGALSAMINNMFAKSYPNLVLQAVGLTFGVALAMFLLYSFRIIKVTDKLRSIIFTATMGIAIFYGLTLILGLFGVNMPFMSITNGGMLGIGISLFVVAIAAMNLLLDFDMIERGAEQGAPKFMEWYGAFGLLVTIVWLYIEILKLLSRLASSRN